MKFHLDASIFSRSEGSLGMVSGDVELPMLPPIGSKLSFSSPLNPTNLVSVKGFHGLLTVESLIFQLQGGDVTAHVCLEDIIVDTHEDGRNLMAYLEAGFGLYADEFEIAERTTNALLVRVDATLLGVSHSLDDLAQFMKTKLSTEDYTMLLEPIERIRSAMSDLLEAARSSTPAS